MLMRHLTAKAVGHRGKQVVTCKNKKNLTLRPKAWMKEERFNRLEGGVEGMRVM